MAVRRPGVEVIQDFQQAAASLNLPSLPSLMVGPGFEIATDVESGTYDETAGAPTEFPFTVATVGAIVDLTEPPTSEAEANAHMPVGVTLSDMMLEQKSTATTGVVTLGSTTFNDATGSAFAAFDPDASGAPNYWVEISASGTVDSADVKRHFVVSKTDNNNLVLAGEIIASSTDVEYRILVERASEVVPVDEFGDYGISKASTGVTINPGLTASDGLVVVEADILLSWRALRVDLAGALSVFTDTDSLEAIFGVGSIVPANPGGYAVSLALLNTTTEVNFTGLAADFYTAEETSFNTALEYVEDKDVYGLAILTHNTAVHQAAKTHVEGASVSTVGRERVAFVNRKLVSTAIEVPTSGIGSITSAGTGNGTSDVGLINNGKFRDPTNGAYITDAVGVGYYLEISAYTAVEGIQRSVTPNEADFMEDTVRNVGETTFGMSNGAFTVADEGRIMCVDGATTLANDKQYAIAGGDFIDANTIKSAITCTDELMAATTRTWITTLDRVVTVVGTDDLVYATRTWTFATGATFTSADIGRLIHITGTSNTNDGFFVIESVPSTTSIVTETVNSGGSNETFAGTEVLNVMDVNREILRDLVSDSVNGTNHNWTIKGASFTSADVGRTLRVAGAQVGANDDDFVIEEIISSEIVRTAALPSPSTETFNGLAGSLTQLDIVSITPSTTEDAYITGTRHAIASIQSESEIRLAADPTSGFGGTLEDVVYTITRDLSRTEEAAFIAGYSSSFATRRVMHTWPDVLAVSINGTSTKVPGYFAGAVYSGMTAGLPSQTGFTNLAVAGFVGRENGDDRFNDTQLDAIASGGTTILVQSVPGAALTTRHQLTTDVSTIYFQEFSVTKNVDLIAKFFRRLLAPYIGIYNITDTVLDIIKTRVESGITFLLAARVQRVGAPIRRGALSNISESEILPDTVEVEIEIDVPLPLNNIKITLLV